MCGATRVSCHPRPLVVTTVINAIAVDNAKLCPLATAAAGISLSTLTALCIVGMWNIPTNGGF